MFPIALAFCAGTAALHALPSILPAAALALPALVAALTMRRRPVVAACLAGFVWSHALTLQRLAADWPCDRDGEEIELIGGVAAPAIERTGRTDFDLDVRDSPSQLPLPRRARISWYETEIAPRPGEFWRMTVRLRCRQGMANPGAADRELDLLRQRIDATGYVVGKFPPELLRRSSDRPIERLRLRIAGSVASAVPVGPSSAVLQGLAVGVRGSIPHSLWETFAVTGVAHLVAISGLHVTGCALVVLLVLRLAWRLPCLTHVSARPEIETWLVLAATAGYTWLSGASLPALRTLLMVGLVATLRLLRRALPVHQILALALLLLVAADPLALVSAGFWLSFVATAALIAILGPGAGWRGRLAGLARAQIAITALLTPVLAATFGRVSLVAPVVNAVAIPAFSLLLLPALLAATVLEAAWSGAAAGLWRALATLLDHAWPLLETIARWRASSWAPAAQSAVLVAGAGVTALGALLLPLWGLRLAAFAFLMAITFGGPVRPLAGAWTLTIVDVGQGLAAVAETAHHVLVFDTGPRWYGGGDAARVALVPYLRARGIRRIDLLIASHDDMDHAGGVETLLGSFDVVRTMTGSAQKKRGGEVCRRGDGWQWDRVEFRVLHPPPGFDGSDNNRSCALAVSGTGGRALLLADPEAAAEAMLLTTSLAAEVVLLPHHGSRSSSSPALVDAVGARLGIASAGFGNRWGMPAAEVIERWRAAGTTVLTTAESGAVIIRFPRRPHALEIVTERRDAPRWWRRTKAD